MRLDRFLTQYIFAPFKSLSFGTAKLEIPILMYHSIASDVDDKLHPYFRTVTTPATFEKQMRFLSESGYESLTLSEAVCLLGDESKSQNSPDSSHRWVVITFDDGFRDFYSTAFPILEKYGFKATVFLASGFIDKTFVTGRDCLRTLEIKELAKKGVEFGSHTVSHPQLKELSCEQISLELLDSKKVIASITGTNVSLFSYPYRFPEEDAQFTEMLGRILSEQDYSAGVTTVIGLSKFGDNPLFLKRLPMNDCDDDQLLQAKLHGDYDWVHNGQLAYKKLRRMFKNADASRYCSKIGFNVSHKNSCS
jgi:Polysaccharide deacetylase